jgi:hypothetical protein
MRNAFIMKAYKSLEDQDERIILSVLCRIDGN